MPLGPLRRDILGVPGDELPHWAAWAQAGLMATIVAAVGMDPGVSNRAVLVGVVAVAASGWLALPLGVHLPPLLHAGLTLGILGVVNAMPERLGFEAPNGQVQITLLIVVFLVGEAMSHWSMRVAIPVLVVATLVSSPMVSAHTEAWEIWVASSILAAVVGLLIRALLSTILDLEGAQAELTERATAEERHRIAREVHDVIAHSLTVTMLHLTAARLAVARGDDVAATEALEEAERAGRRSLADVRRTVGLLRSDDGPEASATAPPARLAADVTDLVEGYRTAGMLIDLNVQGDLDSVVPEVGIAVYRTVQEALANVARHTPGATSLVTLDVGVVTQVRIHSRGGSPADQPGTGAGLLGMRERADALGGRCETRPDGDGWLVEVELPGRSVGSEVVL